MLNSDNIIEYLKQNGIVDFSNFVLKDKGDGNFIAKWEYDIAKPTGADLLQSQNTIDSKKRKVEIQTRLLQIDLESLRPLRAQAAMTKTKGDDDKLAALEQEAADLRTEMAGL